MEVPSSAWRRRPLNPAAAQPQVVGHQVHIAHGNGTVLGPDVGFLRIGKDQNGGLCPGPAWQRNPGGNETGLPAFWDSEPQQTPRAGGPGWRGRGALRPKWSPEPFEEWGIRCTARMLRRERSRLSRSMAEPPLTERSQPASGQDGPACMIPCCGAAARGVPVPQRATLEQCGRADRGVFSGKV